MMRNFRFLVLLTVLLLSSAMAGAQSEITREPLFKISEDLVAGLIGMRSAEGKVFVANSSGKFVRFDLETGEAVTGKTGAEKILDFDVVLGQLVYLTEEGRLGGHILPSWPSQTWDACRIEACDEGLILAGGEKAFFLNKAATSAVEIDNIDFALPIPNGFFWTMQLKAGGIWGADLYDCLGNLMSEVYKFSPEFTPTGIELGPVGEEGELLVSANEDSVRKLAFIGNNGRMFWKLDAPEKISQRDVAFDNHGSLLVLEKSGNDLWLNRWKVVQPEG